MFIQHEAALTILRTAEFIAQESAGLLKPFDLTGAQFNVLRILRGSPQGLPCGQISERLITRDPDITRLLDRMEFRELITRERSDQDRRVVTATITANGLAVLKRVDPLIHDMHQRHFSGMTEKDIRQLIQLLGQLSYNPG